MLAREILFPRLLEPLQKSQPIAKPNRSASA